MLLLDEATSALDNRTQEVVTENLDRLRVTRLVVAHHLSTVVNADRIDALEGGNIVETGRFADTMAANGAFARLAERQSCRIHPVAANFQIVNRRSMNVTDQAKQYQQIIAKCWADETFKQRLMDNPREVLKQEGLEVPADISVHVVENTPKQMVLVVPLKPTELSDEILEGVAGGSPFMEVVGCAWPSTSIPPRCGCL